MKIVQTGPYASKAVYSWWDCVKSWYIKNPRHLFYKLILKQPFTYIELPRLKRWPTTTILKTMLAEPNMSVKEK